jgi:cystinosin
MQLYALSYIKVIITVVKYVPQAWLNYKRQSTSGWDIKQILLDLSGGVLSLVQLILDSSFEADWSGVTGNPIKFLLGNVTIVFDAVFVYQHYVLYRSRTDPEEEDDDINKDPNLRTPLLSEDGGLPR